MIKLKLLIINKINLLILAILCVIILPSISLAQSVKIESDKKLHNVGDIFLVKVKLDSLGKQINSLGGSILIPKDIYDVLNIQTGDSFVSLWIEKPTVTDGGQINFAGGLPGGYSGSDGTIFTFVLKAKNEGNEEIEFNDFSAYLNDGRGTALTAVKFIPLQGVVEKNDLLPNEIYIVKEDSTNPEKFDIYINRDPSIENNKYFVSFFAVDKGSGISKYDVVEKPFFISIFGFKKVLENSMNPQILYYQKWGSAVYVRAFDMDGNVTEIKIAKSISFDYKIYIFIILFVIMFGIIANRNKKILEFIKNAIVKIKKWYNKRS